MNSTDAITNKYKTQWGGAFVFLTVSSCILNVIVTFQNINKKCWINISLMLLHLTPKRKILIKIDDRRYCLCRIKFLISCLIDVLCIGLSRIFV